MSDVAEVVTDGFDRVFGPRFVSTQTLGVSTSYSVAATALYLGAEIFIDKNRFENPAPIFLSIGTLCAVPGTRSWLRQSGISTGVSTSNTI